MGDNANLDPKEGPAADPTAVSLTSSTSTSALMADHDHVPSGMNPSHHEVSTSTVEGPGPTLVSQDTIQDPAADAPATMLHPQPHEFAPDQSMDDWETTDGIGSSASNLSLNVSSPSAGPGRTFIGYGRN